MKPWFSKLLDAWPQLYKFAKWELFDLEVWEAVMLIDLFFHIYTYIIRLSLFHRSFSDICGVSMDWCFQEHWPNLVWVKLFRSPRRKSVRERDMNSPTPIMGPLTDSKCMPFRCCPTSTYHESQYAASSLNSASQADLSLSRKALFWKKANALEVRRWR